MEGSRSGVVQGPCLGTVVAVPRLAEQWAREVLSGLSWYEDS